MQLLQQYVNKQHVDQRVTQKQDHEDLEETSCQVEASGESVGRRMTTKTSQHLLCRGGERFNEERIIRWKQEIRRNRARSLWCSSEAKSRRKWAHPYHAGEGWIHNMLMQKLLKESRSRDSLAQREAPPRTGKTLSIRMRMNSQDPNTQNTPKLVQSKSGSESRVHSKDPREKGVHTKARLTNDSCERWMAGNGVRRALGTRDSIEGCTRHVDWSNSAHMSESRGAR